MARVLSLRKTNTNGLVGWWPFDDFTVNDFSGNPKVNGTKVLVGAYPFPTYNGIAYSDNTLRRGVFYINGGAYLSFTSDISLQWNTTRGATMMARMFAYGLNAYTSVIGYGIPSDVNNFWNMFIKNNGKTAVYARANGSAQPFYDGTGPATLSLGRWYHLTSTVENPSGSSCTVKGYVDGVLDGSGTASMNVGTVGMTFVVGQDIVFGGRNVNGLVDDVRVYNRVLSQQEIAAIVPEPFLPDESEMPALPFVAPTTVLFGHNIGGHFSRRVTTIGY